MKQSKQIYYTKYFENNWNNINITITVPQLIEFNNRTISYVMFLITTSLL